MKELIYKTQGTCSQAIRIVIDDNRIVQEVQFLGGCNGNTSGISALVKGMKAEDVVTKLRGITCGFKSTSCPDQLSRAMEESLKEMQKSSYPWYGFKEKDGGIIDCQFETPLLKTMGGIHITYDEYMKILNEEQKIKDRKRTKQKMTEEYPRQKNE